MMDDVGGYAVDKVKFFMELTPEEAVGRRIAFENVFIWHKGPNGGKACNVVSIGKGSIEGTFKYIFDVWGEAAASVDELPFLDWYEHLDRMDLKKAMPITDDGLENLYHYLEEKIGKNRKIVYQRSPVRQKRGDRDSGGHSLALGSHHSDLRAHWTQRGHEAGYQEFQVQGEKLRTSVLASQYYVNHPELAPRPEGWDTLARAVLAQARVELSNLTGLWDDEVASILSGNLDCHGIIESKLQMLEYDIKRLPESGLHALYHMLEEKLFGLPQPPQEPPELDGGLIINPPQE